MKINIKGININYTEKGQGECILLLHGWGADMSVFANMINHLSRTHKVYALDLPGFGDSDEPGRALTVNDYVDYVLEFINAMNIKDTSLLGHSFGGRIIIRMVTQDGLKVKFKRIVLMDAAGVMPAKNIRKTLRIKVFKMAKSIFSLRLIQFLYPNLLISLRKKFGSADYNAASPVMRETLVKVINEDLTTLLPEIMFPTLLIWGEMDADTPLSDGLLMEKMIPDSGLVVVPNAGHYPFLEQPGYIMRILDSFYK